MTELIWDGKYDKTTNKKVAPLRVALPFQTVETVNESAAERDRTLNLFAEGRDAEWRNRLIWGDKKYVLPSLLTEFAGKVDLVYIDPPFDTGANFSYMATVPDDPETPGDQSATFVKEPSVIEQKAYRDTWGKGLDSYLKWFYDTVVLLRDLLSEKGSIYVHLDYHICHYAKTVLDEVFGNDKFENEIIWKRTTSHSDAAAFGNVHDVIYYYAKSEGTRLNEVLQAYDAGYIDAYYRYVDENGRKFMSDNLTGAGSGPARKFGDKTLEPPPGRHWMYDQAGIDKALAEDKIFWTKNGIPRLKRYADEASGMRTSDLWTDIEPLRSWHKDEAVSYATQKPEALLERIIKASSNEGDLVLDCFCGSGTTAAVAEKLGRRWITCDLGRFAIHTARKRLLSIDGVKPFAVQNLGKYERQTWQADEFGATAEARQQAYRRFILDLYRARPLEGRLWLHGVKNGRMVHVGSVDAPVSAGDIGQIAKEFKRTVGTGADAPTTLGVDVLGWDFAFELNEAGKQAALDAGVQVRFVRIPREVLEKKAVEQGDIRFFELAALSVDAQVAGATTGATARTVTLTLTDFVIPPDDVPAEIQNAITHWSQWIDYWAVDWDNKGDSFHNEWQAYRTKKKPDLQRTIIKKYDAPGEYRIVVKVIDILGNDTTKTLAVEVK